jgi:hypothetical protein
MDTESDVVLTGSGVGAVSESIVVESDTTGFSGEVVTEDETGTVLLDLAMTC